MGTRPRGCELQGRSRKTGKATETNRANKAIGIIAATSMNWAGKVMVPAAREMVTFPSSNGWRMVSSTLRLNSGNSSRNRTPWWAREISPGVGLMLPPSNPASLAV